MTAAGESGTARFARFSEYTSNASEYDCTRWYANDGMQTMVCNYDFKKGLFFQGLHPQKGLFQPAVTKRTQGAATYLWSPPALATSLGAFFALAIFMD